MIYRNVGDLPRGKCSTSSLRSHIHPNIYFKEYANQRLFMDQLFRKLKFRSFDDWKNLSKRTIMNHGGQSLLYFYHEKDLYKLLSSIYPNYPWDYFDFLSTVAHKYFKSQANQRDFMEYLYKKFSFESLEDWKSTPKRKISLNGGYCLLKGYNNSQDTLLRSLYPNYPWDIKTLKTIEPNHEDKKRQREIMEKLFSRLELHSLEDWLTISKSTLQKAKSHINQLYYYTDFNQFLSIIYPNFPWRFEKDRINKYKGDIENQRVHMAQLYEILNLTSLDDWLQVPMKRFKQHGMGWLLQVYENDVLKLLTTLYPSHSWNQLLKYKSNTYFKSLSNQRKFMLRLYKHLKLDSLEGFYNLSRKVLRQHGAQSLIKYYYKSDIKRMLSTIYPNFPWEFDNLRYNSNSIETQRQRLNFMFKKLNLQSFDDWVHVSKATFIRNGLQSLVYHYYGSNKRRLLSTVYPNYPWEFDISKGSLLFFRSWENQRLFMNSLFHKLKLQNLSDFTSLTRKKFAKNGALRLIKAYSNDLRKMLSTIYPNFPISVFQQSPDHQKIKQLMMMNLIRVKIDWYRISNNANFHVPRLLRRYYSDEKWSKSAFTCRNKKSKQRILFISAQRLYPTHFAFENYKHPYFNIDRSSFHCLELDIFLPTLNIAFEYQGRQHFDDIPQHFNFSPAYLLSDSLKITLSNTYNIRLIHIPYWWDLSVDSLQHTICKNTIFPQGI